jgi:hypothetical protein
MERRGSVRTKCHQDGRGVESMLDAFARGLLGKLRAVVDSGEGSKDLKEEADWTNPRAMLIR